MEEPENSETTIETNMEEIRLKRLAYFEKDLPREENSLKGYDSQIKLPVAEEKIDASVRHQSTNQNKTIGPDLSVDIQGQKNNLRKGGLPENSNCHGIAKLNLEGTLNGAVSLNQTPLVTKPISIERVSKLQQVLQPTPSKNEDILDMQSKKRNSRTSESSGENYLDVLFHNHKSVSTNEIINMSLKDSVDFNGVSIFQSRADFEDLGLATHRPESSKSYSDLSEKHQAFTKHSVSSESFLLSLKTEELRDLLGDKKYKEFIEKSERDLSQLHPQKLGESPSEFISKGESLQPNKNDASAAGSILGLPLQKSGSQISITPKHGSSPRRTFQSSSPQMVSKSLLDLAKSRECGMPRNYEQVVIPHNITYSADEIYRQAYGGSGTGRGSPAVSENDLRRSTSSCTTTNFPDPPGVYWNGVSPQHMAGSVSPASPHVNSSFQGPFSIMPPHSNQFMYPPPVRPFFSDGNGSISGSYMYQQGSFGMAPGLGGQSIPSNMFMPVSTNTPASPEPHLYHQGLPFSHTMPCFYGAHGDGNSHAYSPGGSTWQQFRQQAPAWNNFRFQGESSSTHPTSAWREEPVILHAPHPPAKSQSKGAENQRQRSVNDVKVMGVNHTIHHAEAIKQHHEQRRQVQDQQAIHVPQKRATSVDFSVSSLERYFASLGATLPPHLSLSLFDDKHPDQSKQESESEEVPALESPDICESEKIAKNIYPVSEITDKDTMTVISNNTLMTDASIKAGGITERLEELGVDPILVQNLKRLTETKEADKEMLDALQNLVRVCPECKAVNKEYMTWCLQCGGVLIGIDAVPARSLKRKNKQKPEAREKGKSFSKSHGADADKGVNVQLEKSYPKQCLEESTEVYDERKEDQDIINISLTEELDKHTYILDDDELSTKEESLTTKDSPESGKGASSSSSPAGNNLTQDNFDDSEIQSLEVIELTEIKDSGRPSSGEGRVLETQPSQPVHLESVHHTEKEINDICEVINDPIIRGFIKNYLQKKPSQSGTVEKISDKNSSALSHQFTTHYAVTSNENKKSGSLMLDLGASIDSALNCSNKNSSKVVGNSDKRKHRNKKSHEPTMDVEIFAIEEAKQCRSSRSSTNIVPTLNLALSSDEDDNSSDKKSSSAQDEFISSDEGNQIHSSNQLAENAPLNYSNEIQAITTQINVNEPEDKSLFNQVALSSGEDLPIYSPLRHLRHSTSLHQQQGKTLTTGKVRASIEALPHNRRWTRSSIAWSSYHPRELRTRSSINFHQGGMVRQPGGNVKISRSTDNVLTTNLRSEVSPNQRPRPASADQQSRRISHHGRPSSAGRGGRPHSIQAASLSQSWHQVEVSDSVGDQQPSERDRQHNSLGSRQSASSSFPFSADHRLPIQERTLSLIPAGPSTALQIYDRCSELTPRIKEGELSKWLCLPDELWLHVFSYLPQSDLAKAARTCKQLYRVALDETLWNYLTVKKMPGMCDEWLAQIAQRHPISLALIQCHGDNVTSEALRDLFREIAADLKELNFSRCSRGSLVGDNILLHASARCRNLTHVDASWCHVTDNGLSALAECCHRLESLCLNGCQLITDEGLETILKKHGQSLRVLELFGCFGLTQKGFLSLASNCTLLTTLNIGQCYKVTDSCVATLSANLGRVEHLDLRGCKQIKDNCIRKVVRNCPRLRVLTLANCPDISDAAIVEIATYLTDIRVLDVCGCRNITDASIRSLVNNCTRLTSLDISSTSCTQKSILALANSSRCLECVKLNFLQDITENSLLKLIKSCKRLNTVHLYGCKKIRELNKLKMSNPFLDIEM